jgi:hypothetical protein
MLSNLRGKAKLEQARRPRTLILAARQLTLASFAAHDVTLQRPPELHGQSPLDLAARSGRNLEAILNTSGHEVHLDLRFKAGRQEVPRVVKTKLEGRIHAPAATALRLPKAEAVEIDVAWAKDVIERVSRADGAGKQKVKKVARPCAKGPLFTSLEVAIATAPEGRPRPPADSSSAVA